MNKIRAFIGHSFEQNDESVVLKFIKLFDSFKGTMDFDWDHAEETQIGYISQKVIEKMEGKNLFIGIFTKKNIEIEESNLQKHRGFFRDKITLKEKHIAYGTSYWIFQESGYAIAKKMKPLFLIEKGVRKLDGLQADTEFIEFCRGKETECFQKINDALASILKDSVIGAEKNVTSVSSDNTDKESGIAKNKSTKISGEMQADENQKDDKHFILNAYFAIRDKKLDILKELDIEYLRINKGNEVKIIEWQASILSFESLLNKKDVLSELISMQDKYPDNPLISNFIGNEYEKYNNFEKAVEEYLKSASNEEEKNTKLLRIGSAAQAYAKNSQGSVAIDILLKELNGEISTNAKGLIYEFLSEVSKIVVNDDLFIAFLEKALIFKPNNDSLRFDLAYKYSSINKNELALYHYKILVSNSPSPSNYNNIGVAYDNLKMPGKSVEFYINASKMGLTLSRTNIAHKLLNEGFVDYANEQISKTSDLEKDEKEKIGNVLSRIGRIYDEEKRKEKEVLDNIVVERQFNLDYADAFSIDFKVKEIVNGDWSSKHGFIAINLQPDGILFGKKEEVVEDNNWLLAFALTNTTGKTNPEKSYIKIERTFQGKITKNRAFEYRIKVEKSKLKNDKIVKEADISEFSGYGIVNKEMNLLNVVEFDKDKKQYFAEIKKLPPWI